MPRPKTKGIVESVGQLLREITQLEYTPTLVGGMALALLGSDRVTKDFDFLIEDEARMQKKLMAIFYKHGFELVSKLNATGGVMRTVDNPNVAHAKLNMNPPKSAYFFNRDLDLRIDLLFDFPIPARRVARQAQKKTIRSFVYYIADISDLITMKEIALKERNRAADQHDLEFLKNLQK